MSNFVQRRWYWGLFLIFILVVVGYRNFISKVNSKAKAYEVKKTTLKEILSFSGGVDAMTKSTMVFQTNGKLSFIKTGEGKIVKKGQLLAGLDTGDLKAAERAAYYKYLAADANAKQVEDSVKDHANDESYTQKNSRVAAQTDRDIKYDSWLTAQRTLGYATLFSPIDGVVYNMTDNHPGEFITATNQFEIQIIDPATIVFTASADQTDVVKLKEGLVADIVLDSYPDRPLKGTISQIAFTPTAGEAGTVYEVTLSLDADESNFNFRMGMTGDVSFVLREKKDVLAVPTRYIKTINGDKIVYKKNGVAKNSVKLLMAKLRC